MNYVYQNSEIYCLKTSLETYRTIEPTMCKCGVVACVYKCIKLFFSVMHVFCMLHSAVANVQNAIFCPQSEESTVVPQDAKSWPNMTSAWAGWRRFDIPVDRSNRLHTFLASLHQQYTGSPTSH